MYLLDTNVISEIRKCNVGKGNANVKAWVESVDPNEVFISSVTLMELEIGILLKRRKDPQQASILEKWLAEKVVVSFMDRILSFDANSAIACASFHVPDPKPERDAMIAAIAKSNRMTVVTRNVDDFLMVETLNPWDYEKGG